MKAIEKAIDLLGLNGVSALYDPAISPQAVHKWISTGVPIERCIAIEQATNKQVTCEDLRPDFDWAYIRGTKKAA